MCAVIFNLSSVYLPHADLSTEIDRFKDNQHWVQSYNRYFTYNFSQFDIEYHRANQDFVSFSWYFFENTYNLVISDKNDNIYRAYEFNRSGRLLSIDIGDKSRTIPTNKDKEILSYWKNKLYGDIVQKRKKPIINLQWLYNRLNYKILCYLSLICTSISQKSQKIDIDFQSVQSYKNLFQPFQ